MTTNYKTTSDILNEWDENGIATITTQLAAIEATLENMANVLNDSLVSISTQLDLVSRLLAIAFEIDLEVEE